MHQVCARETNASEPLMKCRKRSKGVKTEKVSLAREKLETNLFSAQVVSGIEVA